MSDKIIIKRGSNGYFVTFPDGDFGWQPSKEFAEKKARLWIEEHGRGVIEWKEYGPAKLPDSELE